MQPAMSATRTTFSSTAGGSFHTLDAAKMAIAGKQLQAIEAALNMTRKQEPVLARFG